MSEPCLLYSREVPITDKIHIMLPEVGDVLDNEEDYYVCVSLLTGMPIDFMVQLDDIGVDFSEINDYDLFLILFHTIQSMDTSLLFGNLDLKKFEYGKNTDTGMSVVYDEEDDIVIDRVVQTKIANTLRKIHHLEKDNRKPGNKEAKEYLLERARKKQKRHKRNKDSQLSQLIIAMVNTEQFKYNFETVRNLTIYQFNESVRQVQHKVDYDNRMHGIYAGTIDPKSISQDDLNWLIHK